MKKFLSKLKKGDVARIINILSKDNYYRQRLLALGILPGANLQVARVAPLGDPIEVIIDQRISLTLRRKESEVIEIDTLAI